MPQLNHEQKQRLFNYFSEAHDLLLLEDDFRMIDDLICSQNSVKLPVSRSAGCYIAHKLDYYKDDGDGLFYCLGCHRSISSINADGTKVEECGEV